MPEKCATHGIWDCMVCLKSERDNLREDLTNMKMHESNAVEAALSLQIEFKNMRDDRDRWKKACKLACEWMEHLTRITGQAPIGSAQYFYKKAGIIE